ncbi:MBOAT family O-acyltransferase [Muricoccus radiodurans]|uniref:MBOAT family O-acyltransferase n=1 Tax=Muricoccus radiodurans TaxID=2231721 RepID=UPI003CEF9E62
MLFNSDLFLFVFLPVTYLLFLAVAGRSAAAARLVLVVASCTFYGAWRLDFLPLLLASAAGNYALGLLIGRLGRAGSPLAGAVLAAGVTADLGLLGYYKYAGFFSETLGLGGGFGELILPLGISFYTFTQIAYLVDVRGEPAKAERDPVRYLLFVTVFPHLIAGPILHHRDMIPQFSFRAAPGERAEDFVVGLAIFVLGLFKKVILADGVQPFIALAFGTHQPGVQEAWVGALAFTLQLYFDFSGYSDMAIGLARMFGLRFPLNFDSPYRAESIIDFWRRWHMTLSRFLRDYLYIPLGGNRAGLGHLPNLMITMMLGGLWHGAGWTYVAWGALHGAFLIVNHLWRRLRTGVPALARPWPGAWMVARLLTFLCVVVAWVFFRADDMAQAGRVLQGMAGLTGDGARLSCRIVSTEASRACLAGLPLAAWWIGGLLVVAAVMPNTQQIMVRWRPALDAVRPPNWPVPLLAFRPNLGWAAVLAVLFAVSVVWLRADSPFLYYQF